MTEDEGRGDEPQSLEEHLAEYLRDPSLRPLAAVVVIIFATLLAALLLYAVLLRNLFAVAGLTLAIVASGHAVLGDLRKRRFGIASKLVAALWTTTLALAWGVTRSGLF